MAFVHGKNAQFALRDATNTWRDLTSYVTEATVPGKAGVAETTVFGRGAKTFIGGLLEGQLTLKGFWDPTVTSGPDAVLNGLLGTQPTWGLTVVAQVTQQSNYGQFILFPNGSTSSATNMAVFGDAVITDYAISNPVSNVVSFTATFQLSGATSASNSMGTNQDGTAGSTGTTTGAYGLQVIRVPTNVFFTTTYQAASGTRTVGATSYANLIGSAVK